MTTAEELFGKKYEKGEVVFKEGDSGDTMFVVQSGEVEISRIRDDRKLILAVLKRGEFFGEMALMDNQPRSATATVVRKSRLLPIS
ncbi:MAG: cyclic nucleotide-binding domain-containing protein, partial [Pseudomonadota bacterium]